jgi:hypothetical protein
MMFQRRAAAAAIAAAAAVLTASPALASPAATPLTCTASVSNPRPQDYTTETVHVATRGNRAAQVTTTAYYRTSRSVRYTTDPRPGAVSYHISDATPRYRVLVKVLVRSGRQSGSCATSFTPQAKPVRRTVVYPSQTACGDTPLTACTTVAGSFADENSGIGKKEPVYIHLASAVLKTASVWVNYCGHLDTSWTTVSLPAVINVPEAACENISGDGYLFVYTDFPAQKAATQPVNVKLTSSP